LALTPKETIAIALTTGWMGIRNDHVPLGEVTTHRVPISLGLRLVFNLGPARVAVAPVGRMDVVFVNADPQRSGESSINSTELEFHAGGMTTWHLPLPFGFDAVVGAGVSWTLFARDYKVEKTVALEASSLRITWIMGASWSLL
jgi:hypothetical protein